MKVPLFTMAFAASPMPAADVLVAWATVEDGLTYFAIRTAEWAPVAAALGDEKLTELGILASIDDEDLKSARDSIKMSPIKKGAFTMLFGAVKTKFKFATKLVQQIGIGAMSPLTSGPSGAGSSGDAAPPQRESNPTNAILCVPLVARVKLGAIINQGLDQEIPMMSAEQVAKARGRYVQTCGDEPFPAAQSPTRS